ncbi:unnamed protein product [Effrenium voratum]|nr:unnamed protein product [Effrenium voratum]
MSVAGWKLRLRKLADLVESWAPCSAGRDGKRLAFAAAGAALVSLRRVTRRATATDGDGLPRRVALGLGGAGLSLVALKRFAIDGPPEFDPAENSMRGKTVLITGGNTGLGKESALRLARGGATVVLTARSEAKGLEAAEAVKAASGSDDVHFLQLDLADLSNVKSFKERFSREKYGDHIDVLLNNAGVMAIPTRQTTKDGFEEQLGVNHLGHFATDLSHRPSWLGHDHLQFTERLFSKGIQSHPILVAQTLHKLKGDVPHVAFAGRSNVGKSTLLNMLLHGRPNPVPQHMAERKKLFDAKAAPVSATPGRTRHLFRFELGGAMILADLPGYGYARASKEVQEGWRELVDGYLTNADRLERVVSLVDARVGVKSSDEELWELLQERERQLMVVLTKADQCTPEMLNRSMAHVVSLLEMMQSSYVWPYVHAVSGLHGHGVKELRASISMIASDFVTRQKREGTLQQDGMDYT